MHALIVCEEDRSHTVRVDAIGTYDECWEAKTKHSPKGCYHTIVDYIEVDTPTKCMITRFRNR